MYMKPQRIDVIYDLHRASVCGMTILRPASVSVSQWQDFWRHASEDRNVDVQRFICEGCGVEEEIDPDDP